MKKVLIGLLTALMLFAFVSCDNGTPEPGPDPEDKKPVYLATCTMGGVEFDNPDGLSLTTTDGKNYKAVGTLSTMSSAQAKAFGFAEGSSYIAVMIPEISETNKVKQQGWVSSIDSTEYKDKKTDSTKPGKVLGLTNGTSVRTELDGNCIWKVELTNGNTYTIDLSAQVPSTQTT